MMTLLGMAPQDSSAKTFVEKFPQHLTEFKMVKLPDGETTYEGKTTKVKNLYMSETEIPWEVFEIWALRLDQTAEEIAKDPQGKGVNATTRPSRPLRRHLHRFWSPHLPSHLHVQLRRRRVLQVALQTFW